MVKKLSWSISLFNIHFKNQTSFHIFPLKNFLYSYSLYHSTYYKKRCSILKGWQSTFWQILYSKIRYQIYHQWRRIENAILELRVCLISINHLFLRCEKYYISKWTYNDFPGIGKQKVLISPFNITTKKGFKCDMTSKRFLWVNSYSFRVIGNESTFLLHVFIFLFLFQLKKLVINGKKKRGTSITNYVLKKLAAHMVWNIWVN